MLHYSLQRGGGGSELAGCGYLFNHYCTPYTRPCSVPSIVTHSRETVSNGLKHSSGSAAGVVGCSIGSKTVMHPRSTMIAACETSYTRATKGLLLTDPE